MIAIEPHAIHLWIVRNQQVVDTGLLKSYGDLLNFAEAEQQQRFRAVPLRHQYLISRALVRYVLSLYFGADSPAALRFRRNAYGKPFLVDRSQRSLCFNLAHANSLVVLGVAQGGEIGVDVERPGNVPITMDIANQYFAPMEVVQLLRVPSERQMERFFDFWTLKQAYIKACGMGLSIPLKHFGYTFSSAGTVDITFSPERNDQPERWQFWQVFPRSGHRIAIAYQFGLPRHPCSLIVRNVVPLWGYETIQLPAIRSLPGSKTGKRA